MRNLLAIACVLASAPAAAQPAPCPVTILRAPDDVRAVVEEAVRAEPTCTTALEVRIIPTEGGLYLLARDEHGRVRERIVPHARAAGALVASWVAADAATAPVTPPAPIVAAPASVPAAAPVETPPPAIEAGMVVAQPAATATPRWLSLGAMIAMSGTGGGGIRAEWDVRTRRSWAFGIAGSATQSGMMVDGAYPYALTSMIRLFDGKVLGYASLNTSWGKWRLRSALGAGLVYTRASLYQPIMNTYRDAKGVFPTGEASLSFGRDLGASWALHAGPIVSAYMQEYAYEYADQGYYGSSTEHRELEAMLFVAVRHRL